MTETSDALGLLQAFSMITREKEGTAFTMHRLVHVAIRKWLEAQGTLREWQEKALRLLSEKFPSVAITDWTIFESLQNHARVVLGFPLESKSLLLRAKLLSKLSQYDHLQGRHHIAEEGKMRAIKIQRRLLGQDDPTTLNSIKDLAFIYLSQSKYKESVTLLSQILRAQTSQFGEKHLSTLRTMAILAKIKVKQGLLQQAEKLQTQVLKTHEDIGTESSALLELMADLMRTRLALGQDKEAEALVRRILELLTEKFGKTDPRILSYMEILAAIQSHHRQDGESQKLRLQTLEISSRVFGKDHPWTLRIMGTLAQASNERGDHKEAAELQTKILDGCRRTHGETHAITLTVMSHLVATYLSLGRLKDAIAMQIQLLNDCKKVNGEQHIDTLKCSIALAAIYQQHEMYEEARSVQVQTAENCEKVFPQGHPIRFQILHNLAILYEASHDYEGLDARQSKLVDESIILHGNEHPVTIDCKKRLRNTYNDQGKGDEVERLDVEILKAMDVTFGEGHPVTVKSLAIQAAARLARGKLPEASQSLEQLQDRIARFPEALQEPETKALIDDVIVARSQALLATFKINNGEQPLESATNPPDESSSHQDALVHPGSIVSLDHLPYGWETRLIPTGRVYFLNRVTQTTTWTHPAFVAAQQSPTPDGNA